MQQMSSASRPGNSMSNAVEMIGEEYVEDIAEYGKRIKDEARSLLSSSLELWHLEATDGKLKVYSRPCVGSELVMVRAVTEVAAEADPLFTFFTSKAGYKVIDPACTNHDDPPFRLWSEREEVAYARAPMEPPVKPRTFLVANVVDPLERLFVSKSILDDALPPGADGAMRAINTFVLRTSAAAGGGSTLEILDFIDMRGDDFMAAPQANAWHAHHFVQDIMQRLHAEMAAGVLSAGVTL